jgi:hypothetical protein
VSSDSRMTTRSSKLNARRARCRRSR